MKKSVTPMSDIFLDPHDIKQYITRYFESANLVKNELEIGVKYTWKHSWMHKMHKNAVIWQTIRNLVLWNDSGFTGQLKAQICSALTPLRLLSTQSPSLRPTKRSNRLK